MCKKIFFAFFFSFLLFSECKSLGDATERIFFREHQVEFQSFDVCVFNPLLNRYEMYKYVKIPKKIIRQLRCNDEKCQNCRVMKEIEINIDLIDPFYPNFVHGGPFPPYQNLRILKRSLLTKNKGDEKKIFASPPKVQEGQIAGVKFRDFTTCKKFDVRQIVRIKYSPIFEEKSEKLISCRRHSTSTSISCRCIGSWLSCKIYDDLNCKIGGSDLMETCEDNVSYVCNAFSFQSKVKGMSYDLSKDVYYDVSMLNYYREQSLLCEKYVLGENSLTRLWCDYKNCSHDCFVYYQQDFNVGENFEDGRGGITPTNQYFYAISFQNRNISQGDSSENRDLVKIYRRNNTVLRKEYFYNVYEFVNVKNCDEHGRRISCVNGKIKETYFFDVDCTGSIIREKEFDGYSLLEDGNVEFLCGKIEHVGLYDDLHFSWTANRSKVWEYVLIVVLGCVTIVGLLAILLCPFSVVCLCFYMLGKLKNRHNSYFPVEDVNL